MKKYIQNEISAHPIRNKITEFCKIGLFHPLCAYFLNPLRVNSENPAIEELNMRHGHLPYATTSVAHQGAKIVNRMAQK